MVTEMVNEMVTEMVIWLFASSQVLEINGDFLVIHSDCCTICDFIGVGIGMLTMNMGLIGIYYILDDGVTIIIDDVVISDSIWWIY